MPFLPETVLIRVEFQPPANNPFNPQPLPTRQQIGDSIAVSVAPDRHTVNINVGKEFDLALSDSTNVSERALVEAVCKGVAQLADRLLSNRELDELESQIVANDDARHMHAFHARTFREFVYEDLPRHLIQPSEQDIANIRMGLAFRAESRDKGRSNIRSKLGCTSFLNKLVESLEDELCVQLRQFDRASLIEMAMRNHERAVIDRKRWTRTSRANLGLHQDKKTALEVIVNHDMTLSEAIVSSLVLDL